MIHTQTRAILLRRQRRRLVEDRAKLMEHARQLRAEAGHLRVLASQATDQMVLDEIQVLIVELEGRAATLIIRAGNGHPI